MNIDTGLSATTVTPRVWIGCLHCYNDGKLIGAWYDCCDLADDPEGFDLARIHRDGGYVVQPGCEELWCFDHEWIPERGEFDPLRATRWGELYNELDNSSLWPALGAWVEEGAHVTDTDDMPMDSEFTDRYQGTWETWDDFVYQLAEDAGLQQGWDDTAVRHFNWTSYAEEISQGYSVVRAAGHGPDNGDVYVFRNL